MTITIPNTRPTTRLACPTCGQTAPAQPQARIVTCQRRHRPTVMVSAK